MTYCRVRVRVRVRVREASCDDILYWQVTTTGAVAGLVTDRNGQTNHHDGICGSVGLISTSCKHTSTSPVLYQFTTFDVMRPQPVLDEAVRPKYACNAADSTTGFAHDETLYIKFDEAITLTSASLAIRLVPSQTQGIAQGFTNNHHEPAELSVASPGLVPVRVWQDSSSVIAIRPDQVDGLLVSSQWYDVIIPEGWVTDNAGLTNAGIITGTFCFQVKDTTPPFIADYEPGLGVGGVARDPTSSFIRLTFNEPVQNTIGSSLVITAITGTPNTFTILPADMVMESDNKTLRASVPWDRTALATSYQVPTPLPPGPG